MKSSQLYAENYPIRVDFDRVLSKTVASTLGFRNKHLLKVGPCKLQKRVAIRKVKPCKIQDHVAMQKVGPCKLQERVAIRKVGPCKMQEHVAMRKVEPCKMQRRVAMLRLESVAHATSYQGWRHVVGIHLARFGKSRLSSAGQRNSSVAINIPSMPRLAHICL